MADPRWQQTFYLDRLYAIFRVEPFGSPLLRAVKKVRKRDHFDWTAPEPEPSRSSA